MKPLGEVCEIIGGGTPSRKVGAYYGGDIPWATVGDMNVEQLITTDLSITSVGLENSSSKVIPSGNVIIATRVGLGKSCILNVDTAINQDLKGLVPKGSIGLIPMFLFRWTQSIAPRIIGAGTGATVQGVKITFVSQLPIPIPPIAEQERIVAVLDEAFAAIDKAKANIERNLTNARELFQSRLNDIFSNPSEDWRNTSLVDVCELITCGVAARPNYVDEGIPFLSAKNVKNGRIIFNDYRFISAQDHAKLTKRNKPEIGDVLYTRVGSFGEAAVIDREIEFSIFVSLTLIKPKKEVVASAFLKYYLNSHAVKQLAKNSVRSSGVGNLNVGTVRKFPIKFPPKKTQERLIEEFDSIRNLTTSLELKYQSELDNLEELRQSILEQAFEGKLTEPVAA